MIARRFGAALLMVILPVTSCSLIRNSSGPCGRDYDACLNACAAPSDDGAAECEDLCDETRDSCYAASDPQARASE